MNTPKWLVMVYMQAGDNSQLDSLAVQDLLEMQEGVRKSPEVEVLVEIQRKWPSERQRYRLRCNESPGEPALVSFADRQPPATSSDGRPIDMGSREALADFLQTGFQLEADYYCLVLWGHAYGLGFGRFNHNPLTLEELRLALGDAERRLDVLATNACTMSYIEAAYQLHEKVQYLVASQAFVPLTGLPYKRILRGITRNTEPLDLSKTIVDRYLEDFSDSRSGEGNAGRDEKVAMTVLDLDDRREVGEHLDRLAVAITNLIGAPDATGFDPLDEVRDVFLANPAGDVRPVIDLYSLTNDLIDLCDNRATTYRTGQPGEPGPVEDLRGAAKKLGEAVRPPANIDGARNLSSVPRNGSIVVYHREHPDLEGMSGVGIFAPFVVNKSFLKELELDDKKGKAAYKNLLIFGGDRSNWVSLVYEDLRMDNDVLDEVVDASGVVRPAQRMQVNQLVRAVDAAFNRLDRTLRRTEARIVEELRWKRESKALPAPDALGMFGPPHLKLAGDLSLLDADSCVKQGLVPPGPPHESELDPVVKALGKIERAVELVEKTTRRVITNRTFGLGPSGSPADGMLLHLGPKPAGDQFGPKPAGDQFGPKPAGDQFGPKPAGDQFGPKPAGDQFGPKPAGDQFGSDMGVLFAYMSSDPKVASLAVCTLISLAASSLVQLEQATAGVEAMAAQFMFKPEFGAMLSSRDYATTIEQRFQDAFGVLTEVALQARRTIRGVLAHPVYGLGPGPAGLGQAERDALATSAGFNRRNLALLSTRGVPTTPAGVAETI